MYTIIIERANVGCIDWNLYALCIKTLGARILLN